MPTIGNLAGGSVAEMRIDVPEGWFYKESFTLLAPDGQANVILSSEPLDQTLTTEAYAATQGGLISAEFPGFREWRYERVSLRGGGVAMLRVFEWQPPDGVAVTQAQLYYVADGRGFTSTATTPSTNFQRAQEELFEVLRSISVQAAPTS